MPYQVQPPSEFSLFTVPTSSQRMNGHQIHQTSNPLDYHVRGVVLQVVHGFHPKPKTIPELKSALQQICDDLPRTVINKAINDFHKLQPHARRPVVDILNIRQELYTEIF